MERPKRSPGVTAAAVVVFAGSGFVASILLLALVSILLAHTLRPARPEAATPANLTAMLATGAAFYGALAAWGITTGVGLLRLRSWARASILIFSGLLAATAIFSAPVLFLISRTPQMQRDVPGFQAAMLGILVFMGFLALVGIWWLVLFSLKSVRAQFDESGTTGAYSESGDSAQARAMKPRRPLSISIIAWLYLSVGPGVIWQMVRPYPSIVGGCILEGSAARAFDVIQGGIALTLGIGLLKLKPWARLGGICLSLLHFVNGMLFYLLPGRVERLAALIAQINPEPRQPFTAEMTLTFLRYSWVIGFVPTLVILWFLVRSKAAFSSQTAGANPAATL